MKKLKKKNTVEIKYNYTTKLIVIEMWLKSANWAFYWDFKITSQYMNAITKE